LSKCERNLLDIVYVKNLLRNSRV